MMWNTVAELHAALNDLPPALLLASVVFDIAGHVTKRESLRAAGFWALMGAAVGAVFALVSGLRAEDVIEHGSAMHRFVERHETLAITFTIFVLGLSAWRIVRGRSFGKGEARGYLVASVIGLLGVVWVAKVGGTIMFEHAGGIQTRILEASLEDRRAGHAHEAGAEEHEHPPGTPEHEHDAATPDSTSTGAADHEHPPGTPEHAHE